MTPEILGNYFEETGIPYILVASGGKILAMNASSEKLISSVIPDADKNDPFAYVWRWITPAMRKKMLESIETRERNFSIDLQLPGNDGGLVWIIVQVTSLPEGSFFCIIRDVSSQKKTEQILLSAKEDAERTISTKSQFLANVSHEIRTPIQTIIGMMELLSETKLDKEQTEYTRQVRFSADVLLALVNDILDFSKIELGKYKLESIEFDLTRQIERTVDLLSMEAHSRNLEIIVDIDPELPQFIIGDPNRIQQILLNLVKNAVKFTPAGYIIVSVSGMPYNDGQGLHFEIADTGIGVPEENRQALFSHFYQGDSSTTRKFGGTGLGLAISKNLVELMHGEIGFKARQGRGSIFWFTIPYLSVLTERPCLPPPDIPSNTRFLVVDDNQVAVASLVRKLGALGCVRVETADSGAAALSMLRRAASEGDPFKAGFVDMIMPEMDGWRLAAEITGDHSINEIQLFLMIPEGRVSGDAKMKLLKWFNGYLYKPVKIGMLRSLLKDSYNPVIDLESADEYEEVPPISAVDVPAADAETHVAAGLRILVAEDHPVNQKLMRIFLEKMGAEVFTADNGAEAAALYDSGQSVDIVFMDIQMPVMNGVEASAVLRNKGFCGIIIACTANMQREEFSRYYEAGMNDVLIKPFKKQDVKQLVYKWRAAFAGFETAKEGGDLCVLNYADFLDTARGDRDFATQLIGQFITQTLNMLTELSGSGDLERTAQIAHALKGSAAILSADRMSCTAARLEEAAKAGDMRKTQEYIGLLSSEFEVFQGEAEKWKKRVAETK